MPVEFFSRFDGKSLAPVNAAESEAMGELAQGVDYRTVCTRAQGRSLKQHGLLFALLAIAKENYDGEITTDAILEAIKLRTGHVHVVKIHTGEMIMYPASISFASMDQDAFNRWFPKAIDVLCRDWVPGLEVELAKREIERRSGTALDAPGEPLEPVPPTDTGQPGEVPDASAGAPESDVEAWAASFNRSLPTMGLELLQRAWEGAAPTRRDLKARSPALHKALVQAVKDRVEELKA